MSDAAQKWNNGMMRFIALNKQALVYLVMKNNQLIIGYDVRKDGKMFLKNSVDDKQITTSGYLVHIMTHIHI